MPGLQTDQQREERHGGWSRAHLRPAALILALAGLAAAPVALASTPAASPPDAHDPRKLADFEQALDRLGEWVAIPRLGPAWRPTGVEADWRPYFHGSWTYTEDGWFWVTDEPWGWVTYHYGRWLFDGGNGWVWSPGRVWAPAWVAWRWNAEAVGWAPLPPSGAPLGAFWTFVPASRFVGERVEETALPAARVPALLVRTRPSGAAPSATAARRESPPERRAGAS